jgi:hypothetical protein
MAFLAIHQIPGQKRDDNKHYYFHIRKLLVFD